MAGRKPLATGHVDRLYGSPRAKDRLRMFLDTLRGTRPVPDACAELELSETQFHVARHQWLQEALELLEPRRLGRPPRSVDVPQVVAQNEQLQAETARLKEEVQVAQVREEINQIKLAPEVSGKKMTRPR